MNTAAIDTVQTTAAEPGAPHGKGSFRPPRKPKRAEEVRQPTKAASKPRERSEVRKPPSSR
jgi:hypothetical protein